MGIASHCRFLSSMFSIIMITILYYYYHLCYCYYYYYYYYLLFTIRCYCCYYQIINSYYLYIIESFCLASLVQEQSRKFSVGNMTLNCSYSFGNKAASVRERVSPNFETNLHRIWKPSTTFNSGIANMFALSLNSRNDSRQLLTQQISSAEL
jgi:hypothetical protein